MRTILAIAVISCLFVVASSQFGCVTRATDVASCVSQLGSNTDVDAFCRNCGNTLVSYYRDCTGGVGVDQVQAGMYS